MDSGFSYGDIIVFGAIAAFILLRYRAMLGEKNERDDGSRARASTPTEFERVIQLPASNASAATENKPDDTSKYGTLAVTFVAMRAIDREFSPDEFSQGARAAYEMVLEAYSKADRDTLKMLLSDTLYKNFDTSLTEDRNAGRVVDTTLVAITKADITDAKLSANVATITVEFTSDQIHLVRDSNGTILEGSPSQQNRVVDSWVFTRNLSSSDPNWKVIES